MIPQDMLERVGGRIDSRDWNLALPWRPDHHIRRSRSATTSTIRSCQCGPLHDGYDPLAYLHDVLTRLPRYTNHTIDELTPENWAKARTASQKQYAAAA
jgi:hypothetical protein